jgi:hypothetical protein
MQATASNESLLLTSTFKPPGNPGRGAHLILLTVEQPRAQIVDAKPQENTPAKGHIHSETGLKRQSAVGKCKGIIVGSYGCLEFGVRT